LSQLFRSVAVVDWSGDHQRNGIKTLNIF